MAKHLSPLHHQRHTSTQARASLGERRKPGEKVEKHQCGGLTAVQKTSCCERNSRVSGLPAEETENAIKKDLPGGNGSKMIGKERRVTRYS